MHARLRIRILFLLVALAACQADLSDLGPSIATAAGPPRQTVSDTDFVVTGCEIRADRTAVCTMRVSNRLRDKKIEIDRRIRVQDDRGTEYAVTSGGFGDPSGPMQWSQIAVADSDYTVTLIAPNLSSDARSIRAVLFTRLLVRSTQGQALGMRDHTVFARPPMIAAAPARAGTPTGPAPVRPATGTGGSGTFSSPGWHATALWDYDAEDGRSLALGMRYRDRAGAAHGVRWPGHLELVNHAELPPRARTLWPVRINTSARRICANYPGYPSYTVFVDLPGESGDGAYQVAECIGE